MTTRIDLSEVKNPQLRRVIEKALLIADAEVASQLRRARDLPLSRMAADYERALVALQLAEDECEPDPGSSQWLHPSVDPA